MPGPGPRARDTKVVSQSAFTQNGNRRVADLQDQTAHLERQLSDARMSLERELALLAGGRQAARVRTGRSCSASCLVRAGTCARRRSERAGR